jgi:hypothetical protein
MIWHEAIGENFNISDDEMLAHQPQKVEIVFPLKKYQLAIIATVIDVVDAIFDKRH